MAWVLGVGGNPCSHREIVQTPQTPSEVMLEPGRPELCDNSSTSWPLCSWDFRSLASGMQAILSIHQSWRVWSEPGQWGWWPGRICQHWFTSIARSRNLQSLGGTVSEFLRGQKKKYLLLNLRHVRKYQCVADHLPVNQEKQRISPAAAHLTTYIGHSS